MGALVTGFEIVPDDIAEALHALADDIAEKDAFVNSVSDHVDAPADEPIVISIQADVLLTEDARYTELLDLSNIGEQ